MSDQRTFVIGIGCGVVLGLVGCSSSTGPAVKPELAENLARIETAYEKATARLGRPPWNREELRPFLQAEGDPETILRSPRDGLPYVILWGRELRGTAFDTLSPPLLAHEQQGADGRRYVLTAMGILSMTDEEFEQSNRGKKP